MMFGVPKPILMETKEYLQLRLQLLSERPDRIEKNISEQLGIAVAIFGGIGFALFALHSKDLSPILAIIFSMFVSVIGSLVATLFIFFRNRAAIVLNYTAFETDMCLKELNCAKSKEMNIKVNDIQNKDKMIFTDPLNPKKESLDIINIIFITIRYFMIAYFVYSVVALGFQIDNPVLFKGIW